MVRTMLAETEDSVREGRGRMRPLLPAAAAAAVAVAAAAAVAISPTLSLSPPHGLAHHGRGRRAPLLAAISATLSLRIPTVLLTATPHPGHPRPLPTHPLLTPRGCKSTSSS